ncbi:hypothetical protein DFH08DRAFT_927986 [Mycena albidolilacea]|uniref:Apple domain-containing protein n=1 Tax=Mycena albidolilacea TaxID=1033008 RepID=A0AAD7AT10_9AGAR|nr:hypothetical protein DFH08DRAFT_927986 [Mycena albidolilacea]
MLTLHNFASFSFFSVFSVAVKAGPGFPDVGTVEARLATLVSFRFRLVYPQELNLSHSVILKHFPILTRRSALTRLDTWIALGIDLRWIRHPYSALSGAANLPIRICASPGVQVAEVYFQAPVSHENGSSRPILFLACPTEFFTTSRARILLTRVGNRFHDSVPSPARARHFSVHLRANLLFFSTVFSIYPRWDMENGGLTISGGTEQECLKTCMDRGCCFRSLQLRPYGTYLASRLNLRHGSIDLTTFKTQTFDVNLRTGWTHTLFHRRCTGVTQVASHIMRPKDSLNWVVVVAYMEEIL